MIPEYLEKFGMVFNTGVPLPLGGITIHMRHHAISGFEATLTFSIAPLDGFAHDDQRAMPPGQKRGALLFIGKARYFDCHAVAGQSNEMFSDFKPHRISSPQLFEGCD